MVFHAINKNVEGSVIPVHIDEIPIERVSNFNFFGLNLNENMSWKSHIDIIKIMVLRYLAIEILNVLTKLALLTL